MQSNVQSGTRLCTSRPRAQAAELAEIHQAVHVKLCYMQSSKQTSRATNRGPKGARAAALVTMPAATNMHARRRCTLIWAHVLSGPC